MFNNVSTCSNISLIGQTWRCRDRENRDVSQFGCETDRTICSKFLFNVGDRLIETQNTQTNISEQTSNMAHEARLKQSQIKQEAEKSKIKLITQKELIKGSITRLKKDIRNLHWSEENGLSSQKLLPAIDESYDKLGVELTNLVNE